MNAFLSMILFFSLILIFGCSMNSDITANNANISTISISSSPSDSENQANDKSILFSALPVGSSCIITQDSHDTWASWSPDDSLLAFISPISGLDNLYLIKINDLKLLETKEKNIYVAEYLTTQQTRSKYYIQKTFSSSYIIDGPEWSPNGKNILLRTYDCSSTKLGCKDFKLLIYDLDSGYSKTVFKSDVNIKLYCWLDNNIILLTTENDNKKIYRLDLTSAEKELVFQHKEEIEAFTLDNGALIIGTKNLIGNFNLGTKALEWYKLPFGFNGTRVNRYLRKIILTAPGKGGPAAGWYDLDSKATKLFLDSYDYEPSISNTKRYVAFISEGVGGIVVKRLQ